MNKHAKDWAAALTWGELVFVGVVPWAVEGFPTRYDVDGWLVLIVLVNLVAFSCIFYEEPPR